jgi:UDP-N-acetyl-D-galactosamine dehydrogenase
MERSNIRCGIVGIGYVGMTLAINFDRAGYETVGYDIDRVKIDRLQTGRDVTDEYGDGSIEKSDISFTNSPEAIRECDYVFLSVPTPIDDSGTPDLSGIEAACETTGRHISDGTVVVIESTVYPGATRRVLKPALERGAAAQNDPDFTVGYSPERIVPGGGRGFDETIKLVSAEEESELHALGALYDTVVDAGVHIVDSIEAAEASKCLENIQRDVNIALVNEFTMACRQLDVDVTPYTILEAARTKWNFHDYRPGIVGGHCIPVDPYYLQYKIEECGFDPRMIRTARDVNRRMVQYVISIVVRGLQEAKTPERAVVGSPEGVTKVRTEGSLSETIAGSRMLLLGFSYKPNVSDVRNSGTNKIADELQKLGLRVCGYDPFHDPTSVPASYDFEILPRLDFEDVDAAVLLTPHDELRDLELEAVSERMNDSPLLVDVSNAYDREEAEASGLTYYRL